MISCTTYETIDPDCTAALRPVRDPFGVIYVVDDNPAYLTMMRMSIESLRRFHPDWPIEVLKFPSPRISPLRRLFRFGTFWRREKRRQRAGQDARMFYIKLFSWFDSPFDSTFFLDVDTIVRKPLDTYRADGERHDLLLCSLPWKYYEPIALGQPERIPYQMVGVVFYNRRFLKVYRRYALTLAERLRDHPMPDQFLVSLICQSERKSLSIRQEPHLQMDVLNAAHHFGTGAYQQVGRCVDLNYSGLNPFHVFHYNEMKPEYMAQIRRTWGIRGELPKTEVAL